MSKSMNELRKVIGSCAPNSDEELYNELVISMSDDDFAVAEEIEHRQANYELVTEKFKSAERARQRKLERRKKEKFLRKLDKWQ